MAARDRSRSPARSSGIKIADQKIVFIGPWGVSGHPFLGFRVQGFGVWGLG